jgi:hypothetical protein
MLEAELCHPRQIHCYFLLTPSVRDFVKQTQSSNTTRFRHLEILLFSSWLHVKD